MLVLCRKPNQRIFIGDDIVITVLVIDRNKVRIGIEAPKSLPVFREEVIIRAGEGHRPESLGSHHAPPAPPVPLPLPSYGTTPHPARKNECPPPPSVQPPVPPPTSRPKPHTQNLRPLK